jgi:hypothetical protein
MTTKPLRSRCGVVLKGTWYFGYGARLDKAQLKTLPAGSVYTEPSTRPRSQFLLACRLRPSLAAQCSRSN